MKMRMTKHNPMHSHFLDFCYTPYHFYTCAPGGSPLTSYAIEAILLFKIMPNSIGSFLRSAVGKQAKWMTQTRVTGALGAEVRITGGTLAGSRYRLLAPLLATISACCAVRLLAAPGITLQMDPPSCGDSPQVQVRGFDTVPESMYNPEQGVQIGLSVYNDDGDQEWTFAASGNLFPLVWFGSWGPRTITLSTGVNIITVWDNYEQSAAGTVTVQTGGFIWAYFQKGVGSYSLKMGVIVKCGLAANTPNVTMAYDIYESPGSDYYTLCINGIGIPMTDWPGNPVTTDGSGTLQFDDTLFTPAPPYGSSCANSCAKTWHVLDVKSDIDATYSDDTAGFTFSTTSPVLSISDSQILPGATFQW
jgi:hypothetical protein